MKSWIRITLVISFLVGGTAYFGYWSVGQFHSVFDSLNTSLANSYAAYPSFKHSAVSNATASPELSLELATSTATTATSTSSLHVTSSVAATSTVSGFSFTFPKKGDEVYIGCTYDIAWQAPEAVISLETALVDAGIREPMGPIASGLAKENTVEGGSQKLKWKVGSVWPGAYYIKISKLNGTDAEFRSQAFAVSKMSVGLSASEKGKICKDSGGSL